MEELWQKGWETQWWTYMKESKICNKSWLNFIWFNYIFNYFSNMKRRSTKFDIDLQIYDFKSDLTLNQLHHLISGACI